MTVRNSSFRFARTAGNWSRGLRSTTGHDAGKLGESRLASCSFVRRLLELIEAPIKAFALRKGGWVYRDELNTCIRIRSGGGFATVLVLLCGRRDSLQLEVTGVRRDGLETSRIVFFLRPACDLHLGALDAALAQASDWDQAREQVGISVKPVE